MTMNKMYIIGILQEALVMQEIKSVESMKKRIKKIVEIENEGLNQYRSDKNEPKKIPKAGSDDAYHAFSDIINFFSKCGVINTHDFHIDTTMREHRLVESMEAGSRFFYCVDFLDQLVAMSKKNKNLANLQEFKEALPAIIELRNTTAKMFNAHLDAVIEFLQSKKVSVPKEGEMLVI